MSGPNTAAQQTLTAHDADGNVVQTQHPNVMVMETVRGFHEGYYRDLVAMPLPVRQGAAYFDPSPGLGVTLRPEVLARPDATRRVSGRIGEQ